MNNNIKKIINNIVPMIGRFYLKLQFPIIYYHDIMWMEDSVYNKQISLSLESNGYLAKHGYKTLLFSEVEEFMRYSDRNKDKVVLITFDDGYISNYLHAFPIMKD